jgi:heme/copper-type cytochrome/quinol oxidase subunit 2
MAFFTLLGWLAVHAAALAEVPAAKPKEGESVGSMTYVMAYGLVIFGVVLGMLFVCRSSNRRDRAKPEVFGESKSLLKEDD